MSIIDELRYGQTREPKVPSVWTNYGAVIVPPGAGLDDYYPTAGMTFTVDETKPKTYKFVGKTFVQKFPDGTEEEYTVADREIPVLYFTVSDINGGNGTYPSGFKKRFENTAFVLQDDNETLVSFPMPVVYDDGSGPPTQLAVTMVTQMWTTPRGRSMLQRSYWSNGKLGSYCCS